MSSSTSSARSTKKSAFSCEPCRKRKVKCGGEKPTCNRCAARNDECVYKLNPTLSYTQRLEERIKELESQLSTAPKSPPSIAGSSHSSPSAVGSHDEQSVIRGFRGLKIDDRGGVTYHGVTSFFQLPNDRGYGASDSTISSTDEQRRKRLVDHAWQQRRLEDLSETPEPFQYLLKVHWCWIQPLFNYIYRPAFTRDMQTMGPYYSHTLLNAVLAHSIRWGKNDPATKKLLDESYDGGAVFGAHARSMLFDEISRGVCTVPTAQALLLVSAQECGFGNPTQAWMYSGLAFRLIDHLGISVDVRRYGGGVRFSDEDVEIRHRVFWSCYLWDKVISLYLGRAPTMQDTTVSPQQMMFDDSTENEFWQPFGTPPDGAVWDYPPTIAHSASCFLGICRLAVIFNKILIHMYDPLLQNSETEVQECFRTQEIAMQEWWDQLQPFLKIEPSALPAYSPPSHIVTLNCLYHTFRILLHRPSLTRGPQAEPVEPSVAHHALLQCVNSATSIIAIFDLFCRTFGQSYCILSVSYSVYIAATIFLLQVQATPNNDQALRRLEFCIRSLDRVKDMTPIIRTALGLLTRELSSIGINLDATSEQPHQPTSSSPSAMPISVPVFDPTGAVSSPSMDLQDNQQQLFSQEWTGPQDTYSIPMDPQFYQTMSSLEPLSVRVGALHESSQQQ